MTFRVHPGWGKYCVRPTPDRSDRPCLLVLEDRCVRVPVFWTPEMGTPRAVSHRPPRPLGGPILLYTALHRSKTGTDLPTTPVGWEEVILVRTVTLPSWRSPSGSRDLGSRGGLPHPSPVTFKSFDLRGGLGRGRVQSPRSLPGHPSWVHPGRRTTSPPDPTRPLGRSVTPRVGEGVPGNPPSLLRCRRRRDEGEEKHPRQVPETREGGTQSKRNTVSTKPSLLSSGRTGYFREFQGPRLPMCTHISKVVPAGTPESRGGVSAPEKTSAT